MSERESGETPRRNSACPVCGGPNGCAPAASGSFDTPCWCTTVDIDPAALARVPEPMRGRSCLCRRCATSEKADRRTG